MPRYVALLRGVSPQNCRMPALARAFEAAGFTNVRTIIASGNVAFDTRATNESAIASRAEYAMEEHMGRTFPVIVRAQAHLQGLVARDPWKKYPVPEGAKRVVTFLREVPDPVPALPPPADGAQVYGVQGGEVYAAYVPSPKGPVFMTQLERAFGREVTTRTWDTVAKCARA